MLYQVETKVFNQAVSRNIERFPEKFRFQLTKEEFDALRSQIATSNGRDGRRYRPYSNYSVTRHALAAWLRARDENMQVVPILPMPQGNRHDVTVQVTEQLRIF